MSHYWCMVDLAAVSPDPSPWLRVAKNVRKYANEHHVTITDDDIYVCSVVSDDGRRWAKAGYEVEE